jgi:hypothetical protein
MTDLLPLLPILGFSFIASVVGFYYARKERNERILLEKRAKEREESQAQLPFARIR